jgi:hypothetical protein
MLLFDFSVVLCTVHPSSHPPPPLLSFPRTPPFLLSPLSGLPSSPKKLLSLSPMAWPSSFLGEVTAKAPSTTRISGWHMLSCEGHEQAFSADFRCLQVCTAYFYDVQVLYSSTLLWAFMPILMICLHGPFCLSSQPHHLTAKPLGSHPPNCAWTGRKIFPGSFTSH